jgi:hypothetical protein
MLKLESSLADAAAKSVAALPAKSDAPLARAAQTNFRRLTILPNRSSLGKRSLFIGLNLSLWCIFTTEI